MRATITTFTIAIATTAAAQPAAADGYAEAVVGLAVPVADDDYDDFADESFKVGLRAGGGGGPTKLELSGDFTFVDPAAEGGLLNLDIDAERYRILVGARHAVPVGKASLFVRLGAGVDIVHASATGSAFGIDFEVSDTDPGIAAEAGLGIMVPLGGKLYVGGHLAVPMAFHFDEDDPDDDTDLSFDYTGIDLDLLFTIGTVQ
ncbi:MAG: outer membrane beta-barrel protein [Deltaproteobacteria bacterium]|nr:outer membrane beta-barrel protein [Kofleriaceae bacterium]